MEQTHSVSSLLHKGDAANKGAEVVSHEKKINMFLLALISAVLFGNEVLLTRYFSTVVSVHMVYFVVSAALFGTGIGAYLAHCVLRDKDIHSISGFIGKHVVTLAFAMTMFWGFALFGPYLKGYTAYILSSSVVFLLGGMIMSAIYMKQSENGHEFYFADMMGAVLGCVLVVSSMMVFEFYTGLAVILFGTAAALMIVRDTGRYKLKIIAAFIALVFGISLLSDAVLENMSREFDAYYKNPDKGVTYIADAHQTDVEIIFSRWGAFSRTDVLKLKGDDSVRYILTDGGASAPIVKFDGDLEKLRGMQSDVAYLPYFVGDNDKSLLIGSGGGKDVIYALLSGSFDITAVEINEGTIGAVEASRDFSGDIYNRKGVNLVIGDGRKFVDETTETFDHIYLSMLMSNAIDNSRLSLVENYIFTEEAFDSYRAALKPSGRISFMVHNGIEAVRVVNTWIKTLIESGVEAKEVNKYFLIVNGMKNHGDQLSPVHMPTVILKKTPFTDRELMAAKEFLALENVAAMHLPDVPNELYAGLADGSMTYDEVINQLDANVVPVTDVKPFFYKYSKGIPGEMLPLVGLIVVIGAFLWSRVRRDKVSGSHSAYFLTIGMAYIIVELGFIHSMQRYLEKPVFSFTLVLAGMLAGSAVGALVSGKVNFFRRIRNYAGFIICAVALVGHFWLSVTASQTMMLSIPEKLILVLPIVLFVGFFMGMPFPYAIEEMGGDEKTKKQIPLMYAINGYASVIGSVAALAAAINFGFTAVVVIGAGMYGLLGILSAGRS